MFLDNIKKYEDLSENLKEQYKQKCDICHGQGLVSTENGFEICDCVKKANITARLLSNGFPKKFINYNLDNFNEIGGENTKQKVLSYCNNLQNGLFIHSQDKIKIMKLETIFANIVAYKKNDSGYFYNILNITVEDLIQTSYSSKTNSDMKHKMNNIINNVDILILNFLGDEYEAKNSDYVIKYINNLITQRIFNDKINILSSGLNMSEIINHYGSSFAVTIKQSFNLINLDNKNQEAGETNGYY